MHLRRDLVKSAALLTVTYYDCEVRAVARVCEICGKKTQFGNKVARRGLPKKQGGIGLKTTGISRRKFKPNIQNVRVVVNGSVRRMKVCTSCLAAGKIKKALRSPASSASG